jgi:hypothetical protein
MMPGNIVGQAHGCHSSQPTRYLECAKDLALDQANQSHHTSSHMSVLPPCKPHSIKHRVIVDVQLSQRVAVLNQ